jgi:hypothetical protein
MAEEMEGDGTSSESEDLVENQYALGQSAVWPFFYSGEYEVKVVFGAIA